jgi:hypothetical protein
MLFIFLNKKDSFSLQKKQLGYENIFKNDSKRSNCLI